MQPLRMMNIEFLPIPFMAGLAILLAIGTLHWRRKHSAASLAVVGLFGLYLLILIGLTLFPLPVFSAGERSPLAWIFARVNLVPFRYKWAADLYPRVILHEIVGNILLTIPFGFGISFIHPKPVRYTLRWVIGIGFLIELTQLAASLAIGAVYRGVDIDDVILNGLGALIGYGLFLISAKILMSIKRRFGWQPRGFGAFAERVIIESGLAKKQ